MADIRERARTFLEAVPKFPGEIWSDRDGELFTRLTGYTHAKLVAIWKGGGKNKGLTTCNEFTGVFGKALGPGGGYFAAFMVDEVLKKNGKGHAWVPAADGALPKYGDIFVKTPRFTHMGISLDFKDGTWNTAESGQGLVGVRDIIARKHRTFDRSALAGWVDIELYFGAAAARSSPVPPWLVGWWEVTWRGQAYYYYFNRNHQVKYTENLRQSTAQPPLNAEDTGSVAIESPSAITIRWGATGSVEKFGRMSAAEQMRGTWNGTEPLTAVKI